MDILKGGEIVYSGLEFTVPKGTTFIVQIKATYSVSIPLQVAVTNSKSEYSNATLVVKEEAYPTVMTHIFPMDYIDKTYYVWVKYNQAGKSAVSVRGNSIK